MRRAKESLKCQLSGSAGIVDVVQQKGQFIRVPRPIFESSMESSMDAGWQDL